MTTNYTTRFRFNKPDFRQSPWSSLINENTDRIDEVIYNVLQANGIVTYANNLDIVAGTTVYDTDTSSMWLCRDDLTTAATGTFEEERAANPDDWASVTLGLTVRGQWLINTHYAVNDLVYDASEGLTGYCKTEHTSGASGSMRDEITDWNIIFDSNNGGTVPATAVAYDDTGQPYTAANVQTAINAANTLIEGNTDDIATNTSAIAANTTAIAANTSDISDNTSDIATNTNDIASHATTLASHSTTIAGLGTASTHANSDYATAAQGTKADNAMPKSGGAFTGAVTSNNTFTGSNGRLWGASDFSSVPPQAATSMRWVSGGTQTGGGETSPYMTSAVTSVNPTDYTATWNRRYLQYYINGTWYTVGFV